MERHSSWIARASHVEARPCDPSDGSKVENAEENSFNEEIRRDELGRTLCASLTKRGTPCGAQAVRGDYCVEHAGGSDLVRLGFSHKQVRSIESVEATKNLLDDYGLTFSQLCETFDFASKLAKDDFKSALRSDPALVFSQEVRPNALGRNQLQVVVRLR